MADSLLKFFQFKQDSMDVDAQTFDRLFRTALATKAMDDAPTIQQNIDAGFGGGGSGSDIYNLSENSSSRSKGYHQ